VDWVADVPSCGDTAFPGIVWDDPDTLVVYNYSSPVDGPDEPLYHVKNKQVEITCTMNHKLYVQTRSAFEKGEPFELKMAYGPWS
jgi:hypothetical protein